MSDQQLERLIKDLMVRIAFSYDDDTYRRLKKIMRKLSEAKK